MNRPDRERSHTRQYGDREEVSGIINNHDNLDRLISELDRLGLRDDVSVLMTDQTRDYYREAWGEPAVHSDAVERGVNEREFTEGRERHRGSKKHESHEGNKAPEGFTTGGVAGGLLGAIIGGLTLVGSVLVPGAGLLVAGPLVGALTGGAIGAATGGLVGALVGAGIPEEKAEHYERTLQERGNVLVIAHVPPDRVDEVRAIFNRCGAKSIHVS